MNNLLRFTSNTKVQKSFKYFLCMCIFLYPFVTSFYGIDLGDTGLHTYMFSNLYDTPELIGFTSYFTTVIGWSWLQIFGFLGLWGLNLLEVILEMIMSFTVYKTFKTHLGEYETLIGILVAVLASDTYLNVFNYHQFNVCLLIVILCFEFRAITEDKKIYSVLAGVFFAIVVFSRMGSVTAIVTLFLYLFWYWVENKNLDYLIKHVVACFVGTLVTTCAMIGLLFATGQTEYFVDNIFRLSGLASSSESDYGMNNLLDTFVYGNLDAIASGAILFAAAVVFLLGADVLLKKEKNSRNKIVNVLIAIVAMGIAIYQMHYAYDVNPVASWPQMTTGPSYVIGVFYVITFFCLAYHLYSEKNKEVALIAVIAIVLPLLTIAGSNTGTKHVILGLWIIAPVVVYVVLAMFKQDVIRQKASQITEAFGLKTKKVAWILTLLVACCSFALKFTHMIYYTTNFDSVDRSTINSSINNEKVKYLKTTEREANAVNGVLEQIEELRYSEEDPLMVFGGSLLFYYMTDMNSYVQPWFSNTNYAAERLESDLEAATEKYDKFPIVVYGRTNNYYGFYEYDYETQIQTEISRQYNGKKDRFVQFLSDHAYKLQYVNDYYLVLVSSDSEEISNEEYIGYITGNWGEY